MPIRDADELARDVENYVTKACKENGYEDLIPHLQRTAYWLIKLKPDADEAMLIAAVAHDIERIFRQKKQQKPIKGQSFQDPNRLTQHQEKSAAVIGDYLESLNADPELVRRVKNLVSKHEVGGTEDQNLIKDADSISFLETNVNNFINEKIPQYGKEAVREKFDWMFNRISSEEARAIAEPMYEEAIKRLEDIT